MSIQIDMADRNTVNPFRSQKKQLTSLTSNVQKKYLRTRTIADTSSDAKIAFELQRDEFSRAGIALRDTKVIDQTARSQLNIEKVDITPSSTTHSDAVLAINLQKEEFARVGKEYNREDLQTQYSRFSTSALFKKVSSLILRPISIITKLATKPQRFSSDSAKIETSRITSDHRPAPGLISPERLRPESTTSTSQATNSTGSINTRNSRLEARVKKQVPHFHNESSPEAYFRNPLRDHGIERLSPRHREIKPYSLQTAHEHHVRTNRLRPLDLEPQLIRGATDSTIPAKKVSRSLHNLSRSQHPLIRTQSTPRQNVVEPSFSIKPHEATSSHIQPSYKISLRYENGNHYSPIHNGKTGRAVTNGNCLYDSFVQTMKRQDKDFRFSISELRILVGEEIKKSDLDSFEGASKKEQRSNRKKEAEQQAFPQRLQGQSTILKESWGNHRTLVALSKLFNVEIEISQQRSS